MNYKFSPGYATVGYVSGYIDGAPSNVTSDTGPYYVKVRVFEIHGPDPSSYNYITDDEERQKVRVVSGAVSHDKLPLAKINLPPGASIGNSSSLQYCLVNVCFPSGDPEIVEITGVIRKLSEEEREVIDKPSVYPNDGFSATTSSSGVSSGGSGGGMMGGTCSPSSYSSTIRNTSTYSDFFGYPIAGESKFPVTSEYGARWNSFHYGIDIGVETGTPLLAAADGVVVRFQNSINVESTGAYMYPSDSMNSYGNYVILDHGVREEDGYHYYTKYAHMSKVSEDIYVGAVVKGNVNGQEATVLGLSGNTGNSTGPHLHFEVDVNGTYAANGLDPENYIDFR